MKVDLLSLPDEAGRVDAVEEDFQRLESRAGMIIEAVAGDRLSGLDESAREAWMALILSFLVRRPGFVERAGIIAEEHVSEVLEIASPRLRAHLCRGEGSSAKARAIMLNILPKATAAGPARQAFDGLWAVVHPEPDALITSVLTSDAPVVQWEPGPPNFGPKLTFSVDPRSLFVVFDRRTKLDAEELEQNVVLMHTAHCIQGAATCAISEAELALDDPLRVCIEQWLPRLRPWT